MTLDRVAYLAALRSRVISVHSWYLTSLVNLAFLYWTHCPFHPISIRIKNSYFFFSSARRAFLSVLSLENLATVRFGSIGFPCNLGASFSFFPMSFRNFFGAWSQLMTVVPHNIFPAKTMFRITWYQLLDLGFFFAYLLLPYGRLRFTGSEPWEFYLYMGITSCIYKIAQKSSVFNME